MRCYRTQDGRLVATQKEAGKGFETVDVPRHDKAELLGFINAERDRGAGGVLPPPMEQADQPAPERPAAVAAAPTDIVEAIGASRGAAFGSCVAAAVSRLGELGANGREDVRAFVGRDNPACRFGAGTAFYRGAAILNELAAYG